MLTYITSYNLMWAIVTLVAAPALIIFVRWFGNFETKTESVGSDLNLIGFGFAIELIVAGLRNRPILEKWPYEISPWALVLLLLLLNLFLYMFNLKTSENIKEASKVKVSAKARLLKGFSMFLGLLSAVSYVSAKAFWE